MKQYDYRAQFKAEVENPFAMQDISSQMIKDYLVALRYNARQWSANTKTRAEVNHTTRKPHKQKGTGSARQGSLAAPQYKGGGRVFGPKPKFGVYKKVNRKEKQQVIRGLLSQKIEKGNVLVVEDRWFEDAFDKPKTKHVVELLNKMEIPSSSRVLFVMHQDEEKNSSFRKSARNLPASLCTTALTLNGYDIVVSRYIIVAQSALQELQAV